MRVCGVVLNKVMPEKVEMIRDYFGRVCTKRWGVPLLGVVPDLPFLGKASLGDLERLLKAELIAGTRFRPLHFGLKDVQVRRAPGCMRASASGSMCPFAKRTLLLMTMAARCLRR